MQSSSYRGHRRKRRRQLGQLRPGGLGLESSDAMVLDESRKQVLTPAQRDEVLRQLQIVSLATPEV